MGNDEGELAHPSFNGGELLGIVDNSFKEIIERFEETLTEPLLFLFVPCDSVLNIALGTNSKADANPH